MNFDEMLKIALLFGVTLVAVLVLFFFRRPQFFIGLVLLAAFVELGLSGYQGYETRDARPEEFGRDGFSRQTQRR